MTRASIKVFSYVVDSRRLLYSVGLPQAGKVLLLSFTNRSLRGLRKAWTKKRKKLKAKISKVKAELDRLTEELKDMI